MVAFKPATVVTSAPFGAGIIELLNNRMNILTTLPTKRPIITARTLLKIGFISFVY
jgi:hypothetical protein